jgi:CPA1 family monovalent cation:H+ antiporter
MHEVSTVLVLLCIVTFLAFLTRSWSIPYPTLMVLVGVAIALIPGLPNVQLTPEVVFLIFLPPLLYAAAWQTPIHEFRKNLRPITLLAVGLVIVTTLVVGWVAHSLFAELNMPWAAAFALGAIISPPDAIAASAVTQRLRVPRRIVVILEGESLLNDASGLVVYRAAVAAAAGEHFSIYGLTWQFFVAAIGGAAIGWLVGRAVMAIHRRLDDPIIETIVTLLTPFAAFLICEAVHLSGVLAVVCAGLMVRQKSSQLFSAATRLHATAVWDCVVFVLTGLTFIFIGLQLREVVSIIANEAQLLSHTFAAIAIFVVTVAVRMFWIYPSAYLPRLLSARLRKSDPAPPLKHLTLIGWTGMRGVVSLAAALALPADFPLRNLILYVVFAVILGTLVVQGLSLPWLVRKLGLSGGERSSGDQEMDARLALLAAANLYLDQRLSYGSPKQEVDFLRSHFQGHADNWLTRLNLDVEQSLERQTSACHKSFTGVLDAQRSRLHELIRESIIEESIAQKLERELDMEESRIKSIANA